MKENVDKYLDSLLNFDCNLNQLKQLGLSFGVPVVSDVGAGFLSTLVAMLKPKTILEIGSGVGYSGTILLQSAPTARFVGVELKQELTLIAQQTLSNFDAVVLHGDCRLIVPMLRAKNLTLDDNCSHCKQIQKTTLPFSYDFIFMDGPKSACNQLLDCFVELLNQGGVLVCDNVLFKGKVANFEDKKPSTIVRNLREFLTKIHLSPLKSTVLPIGDGFSLTTKL